MRYMSYMCYMMYFGQKYSGIFCYMLLHVCYMIGKRKRNTASRPQDKSSWQNVRTQGRLPLFRVQE